MSINNRLAKAFKNVIPKLGKEMHKGQNGRVGVVGGSKEYSGAPYFAAMSSLRVGADLSYVATTSEASAIIKSYSPELIVLPILDAEDMQLELQIAFSKIHSIVIGPGLGRSETSFKALKTAIEFAKSKDLPLVIDADGLYIVSMDTSVVCGNEKCILTPNLMEFKRLYEAAFGKDSPYDESSEHKSIEAQCQAVEKLANSLENLTILKKGNVDIISNGRQTITNDMQGCFKRCGGIGDILTGSLGTFVFWAHAQADQVDLPPNLLASYAASALVKESSRRAFKKFHRSLLAVDIIEEIAESFYQLYDKDNY